MHKAGPTTHTHTHTLFSLVLLVLLDTCSEFSYILLVLMITCSEFSLVRNLRWVTAGYFSLLKGSVVQRRNRDGNSSVSMRHFSLTTLTTTWAHRTHELPSNFLMMEPRDRYCSGSDLVKLDRGRAAAVSCCYHDVPSSSEGDVGQRHASSQSAETLACCQQSTTWLQQWHGDQTTHCYCQPALHWLPSEQSQRWGELHSGKLLAKVWRTRLMEQKKSRQTQVGFNTPSTN